LTGNAPDPRLAAPQALNDTTYDFWKRRGASAISSPRNLSPGVNRELIETDDMTYAMWGIVIGLALMFGASLRWYRHSLLRKREIRWLDERHVFDRLRERYRSQSQK
jgi:hypothetical protein